MTKTKLKVPANQYDHRLGSLDAPVVVIEYGDFECPHCAAAAPIFERLLNDFESDLCFIYRHFPLAEIHPHAVLAAIAAEAADQQNEFWKMHKMLLQDFDVLSIDNIYFMAKTIGLDIDKFKKDLKRDELLEHIYKNYNGGLHSGVDATPTVYVNGNRFDEILTYDSLREEIEEELGQTRSDQNSPTIYL